MCNITKELVRRELFECIQKEVGWVVMVMMSESRRLIKHCAYLLSVCLNAVISNDNNSVHLVGRLTKCGQKMKMS